VQFTGVVIGADDGTCPSVALESGQLRENPPVEQDRVSHAVLVARYDDRRARLSPGGDERVDDVGVDTRLIAEDEDDGPDVRGQRGETGTDRGALPGRSFCVEDA
jgi:hypothetical protein